jgi:hypothetical protein
MKRLLALVALFGLAAAAWSQDAVLAKMKTLAVQKYVATDNPTKNVKKLYVFRDADKKGGIAVVTLAEIRMDVFVSIELVGGVYTVLAVEPVNNKAYPANQMQQLYDSFSRWAKVKESAIPDVVTGATRHSKGIYADLRVAVADAIALLKKG